MGWLGELAISKKVFTLKTKDGEHETAPSTPWILLTNSRFKELIYLSEGKCS